MVVLKGRGCRVARQGVKAEIDARDQLLVLLDPLRIDQSVGIQSRDGAQGREGRVQRGCGIKRLDVLGESRSSRRENE